MAADRGDEKNERQPEWLSEAFEVAAVEDPMRLVREARERGVEPRLVTGHDAAGATVVAWHIPDTNLFVVEGVAWDPEGEQ